MSNLWGVLWRSENRLEGKTYHLEFNMVQVPAIFKTRKLARKYIDDHYGYIRNRPDLRREPFGWKMPIAVKVKVEIIP